MRSQLVTEKGGWLTLPLDGMRAEDLLADHWLVVRDGEGEARIGVPPEHVELAKSLVAGSEVIVEARASPHSRLEVMFAGGRVLTIDPHPDVEAWEVRGPGDVGVIGMPGGGEPSYWDASCKTYRMFQDESGKWVLEDVEGEGR